MDKAKLSERMAARADLDNLPANHDLRVLGQEFTKACHGYMSSPQTVSVAKFMGAWARARKCWCEYTGEDLI